MEMKVPRPSEDDRGWNGEEGSFWASRNPVQNCRDAGTVRHPKMPSISSGRNMLPDRKVRDATRLAVHHSEKQAVCHYRVKYTPAAHPVRATAVTKRRTDTDALVAHFRITVTFICSQSAVLWLS
jgi:hypothetical protein